MQKDSRDIADKKNVFIKASWSGFLMPIVKGISENQHYMTEGDFISLPVYQRVASMPEDDLYIIKMKEITKRTVIAIQKEEPSKSLAHKGKNQKGDPVDIQKFSTPHILLPRVYKYSISGTRW